MRIWGGCPNGVVPAQQEEDAESPLRAKILELEKERDRIEEEIKSHADLMQQLGAPAHVSGEFWQRHTPLMDAEGYPRSDIPIMEVKECCMLNLLLMVVQVMEARGTMAKLKIDHKVCRLPAALLRRVRCLPAGDL